MAWWKLTSLARIAAALEQQTKLVHYQLLAEARHAREEKEAMQRLVLAVEQLDKAHRGHVEQCQSWQKDVVTELRTRLTPSDDETPRPGRPH